MFNLPFCENLACFGALIEQGWQLQTQCWLNIVNSVYDICVIRDLTITDCQIAITCNPLGVP